MITCYFGVPGVGKTTLATKLARKGLKKYKHVYTNFACYGCEQIDYVDLANYKMINSLIVLDEITLDADNRDFKTFSKDHKDFFTLHRHLGSDIIYLTQNYENADKKIRDCTNELWYMTKSVVPFFRRFTSAKRIYRNININKNTSELTLGYRFCNFVESIFVSNRKICYRPKYYKYFDTFDELQLKDRPIFESKEWPFPSLSFKSNVVKRLRKTKDKTAAVLNRFRYKKIKERVGVATTTTPTA